MRTAGGWPFSTKPAGQQYPVQGAFNPRVAGSNPARPTGRLRGSEGLFTLPGRQANHRGPALAPHWPRIGPASATNRRDSADRDVMAPQSRCVSSARQSGGAEKMLRDGRIGLRRRRSDRFANTRILGRRGAARRFDPPPATIPHPHVRPPVDERGPIPEPHPRRHRLQARGCTVWRKPRPTGLYTGAYKERCPPTEMLRRWMRAEHSGAMRSVGPNRDLVCGESSWRIRLPRAEGPSLKRSRPRRIRATASHGRRREPVVASSLQRCVAR
jgi:hypothetical protein